MGATQRENMDPAPYEVEFMNVVVEHNIKVEMDEKSQKAVGEVEPAKK